jgi:outer membrane murein-binding lipoprotein Lpp
MSTPESSTPAPAPASGASVAEQFLEGELAATRRALQRTRVAGFFIVVVVVAYMSFVARALQKELEPRAAAKLATTFVQGQVNEKTDALANQVKERIPALVAGLPDYLQRELPRHREALEDRIEQDFKEHCQATAQQLAKHLDDFLQAHIVQIRTLLNTAENKPELLQALAPDLEQEIVRYLSDKPAGDESLKDKIDQALVELQKVETQVDRLARNVNLTPQEKKVRHAIAVIARSAEQQTRQLEMQIQDALRKAK